MMAALQSGNHQVAEALLPTLERAGNTVPAVRLRAAVMLGYNPHVARHPTSEGAGAIDDQIDRAHRAWWELYRDQPDIENAQTLLCAICTKLFQEWWMAAVKEEIVMGCSFQEASEKAATIAHSGAVLHTIQNGDLYYRIVWTEGVTAEEARQNAVASTKENYAKLCYEYKKGKKEDGAFYDFHVRKTDSWPAHTVYGPPQLYNVRVEVTDPTEKTFDCEAASEDAARKTFDKCDPVQLLGVSCIKEPEIQRRFLGLQVKLIPGAWRFRWMGSYECSATYTAYPSIITVWRRIVE